MSSALRKPMTLDEFLAWEESQPTRWEFDGFAPVAMTGGTQEHSIVQANLITALSNRLRGSRCRAHGSDFKIEVDGSIRYPDAFVQCTPAPRGSTVANEPVVVFEILSPSTSRTDRIVKAREYGNTASIVRYVILEPTAMAATVFTHANGVWAATVVEGAVELDMPEIGISLPLAELYTDVEFPPEDEAA
jgi:Uma2 family endonuclease